MFIYSKYSKHEGVSNLIEIVINIAKLLHWNSHVKCLRLHRCAIDLFQIELFEIFSAEFKFPLCDNGDTYQLFVILYN